MDADTLAELKADLDTLLDAMGAALTHAFDDLEAALDRDE
jgi:hypothetical protein